MIRLQDVLRSTDEEEIRKYQRMARMHPYDPDTAELVDLIIEEGLSAWLAAKKLYESDNSNRSLSTLYYRARVITSDMLEVFSGITVSSLIGELMRKGQVKVPGEMASDFRAGLAESGIEYDEWSVFYRREDNDA